MAWNLLLSVCSCCLLLRILHSQRIPYQRPSGILLGSLGLLEFSLIILAIIVGMVVWLVVSGVLVFTLIFSRFRSRIIVITRMLCFVMVCSLPQNSLVSVYICLIWVRILPVVITILTALLSIEIRHLALVASSWLVALIISVILSRILVIPWRTSILVASSSVLALVLRLAFGLILIVIRRPSLVYLWLIFILFVFSLRLLDWRCSSWPSSNGICIIELSLIFGHSLLASFLGS